MSASTDLIFVEGGTFSSTSSTKNPDDYTLHDETVDSFYISKYQTTISLYEKVMGNNPTNSTNKNCPVENVSSYDCVNFCNKLSESESLKKCYFFNGKKWICDFSQNGYRMPSLPEWEFAARGGRKSRGYKYSGSDEVDEVAWYDRNSENHAHEVGLKRPNELGIFDMSGNVGERCWDPSYEGENPAHVGRGGCWIYYEGYCVPEYRFVTTENYCGEGLGIRLVRSKL